MIEAQTNSQSESGCAALERQPPLILFGSSFPKDKHFTQVKVVILQYYYQTTVPIIGIQTYKYHQNMHGNWKNSCVT